jgi:hypothetical protein
MAPKTYPWITVWFLITAPLMLWDAGYCLMRFVFLRCLYPAQCDILTQTAINGWRRPSLDMEAVRVVRASGLRKRILNLTNTLIHIDAFL